MKKTFDQEKQSAWIQIAKELMMHEYSYEIKQKLVKS
jgi:hypothetical protein